MRQLILDIHEIPENKHVKAHLHYDVRFLFLSEKMDLVCSNESLALKWVRLDEINLYSILLYLGLREK